MADSACFLMSYYQPSSASTNTTQAELLRCLTSSASLGRYMSESLNWEKFSTFTENRHMEDVKKHSRPGFVAQMKAHFEAQFTKKAMQKVAALKEQQNLVSRNMLYKSLIQIDNHVVMGKALEEEATSNSVSNPCGGEVQAEEGAQFVESDENHQLVELVNISNHLQNVEDLPVSRCNQNIEGSEQDHTQFAKVENPLFPDEVDVCGQFGNIEDISNLLENVEDLPVSRCNQNIKGSEQDHTQFAKVANPILSDKVDVCGQFGNIGSEQDHTQFAKVENPILSDNVDVCGQFGSIEDIGKGACREDAKAHTMGISELGDPTSLEKRKPLFLSSKSRGFVGVPKTSARPRPSVPTHKEQNKKGNSISRENAADLKIRSAATRSPYMSIEAASEVTKKPMSPIRERLVNSRFVKSIARKANQSTQGKPLQDTVGIQKHSSVSLRERMFSTSKPHRTRTTLSATVCCPFSFKCDDRAIKRKEFFERLEQTDSFRSRRRPSDTSKVIPEQRDSSFVSGEILKYNSARPPWRK